MPRAESEPVMLGFRAGMVRSHCSVMAVRYSATIPPSWYNAPRMGRNLGPLTCAPPVGSPECISYSTAVHRKPQQGAYTVPDEAAGAISSSISSSNAMAIRLYLNLSTPVITLIGKINNAFSGKNSRMSERFSKRVRHHVHGDRWNRDRKKRPRLQKQRKEPWPTYIPYIGTHIDPTHIDPTHIEQRRRDAETQRRRDAERQTGPAKSVIAGHEPKKHTR